MNAKVFSVLFFSVVALSIAPADAAAQHRGGSGGRTAVAARAVPRTVYGPRFVRPRVGVVPYRPYVYRPRVAVGLAFGYPYGYGYRYGYGYPYGYGYRHYGSPYGYGYPAYGYPGYGAYGSYDYGGYAYGRPYGSVRITDAPRDAEVYVDGYYAGIVDDFDGVFQHLNLEPGPHRIEVRAPGRPPVAVDVNVEPWVTITYHARIQ